MARWPVAPSAAVCCAISLAALWISRLRTSRALPVSSPFPLSASLFHSSFRPAPSIVSSPARLTRLSPAVPATRVSRRLLPRPETSSASTPFRPDTGNSPRRHPPLTSYPAYVLHQPSSECRDYSIFSPLLPCRPCLLFHNPSLPEKFYPHRLQSASLLPDPEAGLLARTSRLACPPTRAIRHPSIHSGHPSPVPFFSCCTAPLSQKTISLGPATASIRLADDERALDSRARLPGLSLLPARRPHSHPPPLPRSAVMAPPAVQYDRLLPQSPRQEQSQYTLQPSRPQTKPRSFSVRSDKTHRSGGNDYHETHEEKESKRLHSKADPTLAINEAEPSTVAMMSQSNHLPLRSMQHKDVWGNPITDPDKSNPTRNRWERPLDTIRGFEAAIDGAYSRKSLYHLDTEPSGNWSQRGGSQLRHPPRHPQDSYHGNRLTSYRAETHYGSPNPATARSSYLEPQQGHGGYGNAGARPVPRDRGPRMIPENQQYHTHGRDQDVYPLPHKDRSSETVTSAAPSGNSDPAGYQTDPTSSDNSSVNRVSTAKHRELANDYDIGFTQAQAHQPPNFSVGPGANGYPHQVIQHPNTDLGQYDSRPVVPPKQASTLSRQMSPPQRPDDGPQRRKSWFSRRFSKDA